jgi:molybdenum cofactor cytidylyltransferase
MRDVVGIVLGAGSSTRLGRPKQTLRVGDRALLQHVVDTAVASELDRVVVVVGGAAAEVRSVLVPGRARVVENAAYGAGCASSLLAGLDAAGPCDAVMLLLGDMPGVATAVIDQVLGAWLDTRPWGAVTEYVNGIGHPFVFSADAFPTLRALHGDKAVWKVIEREPRDRVARLAVACLRPLDVDTWDDYRAVCDAFGVQPVDTRAPTQGQV